MNKLKNDQFVSLVSSTVVSFFAFSFSLLSFLHAQELPRTYYIAIAKEGRPTSPVVSLENADLSVEGEVVRIKDGIDLHGLDLRGVNINLENGADFSEAGQEACKLRDADFSGADLTGADLSETDFFRCSFKGANLTGVKARDTGFLECDFTGAIIDDVSDFTLRASQLRSTASYQRKRLCGSIDICLDTDDLDFSSFDLTGCFISPYLSQNKEEILQKWGNISFENATIMDSGIRHMSFEQLASTKDYRMKRLCVRWGAPSLENVDLSGFNLTRSDLYGSKLTNADLTDAVVSDCCFNSPKRGGPQLDQLRSTWDWKNKRLDFNCSFDEADLTNEDLSHFYICCCLGSVNISGADLTDAQLDAGVLDKCKGLTLDQLRSTWNWKNRLFNFRLVGSVIDWPNVDLSNFTFESPTDLGQGDISGADLTGAKFVGRYRHNLRDCKGLTLDQIRSTQNYQTGDMEGIALPPEIQAQLDAEKANLARIK